jgi:methyltransferase family protein
MQPNSPVPTVPVAERVKGPSMIHRVARKLAADPVGFVRFAGDRLRRNVRAFYSDPLEVLVLARERIAERDELRGKRVMGGGVMPWPPCPYNVDLDWDEGFHAQIGVPWPCPEQDEFWRLWTAVMADLEETGLRLGRGAFAGWGDGEPGFVRAVWCLVRHLSPSTVVETGVARGLTSRFILEALERNQTGRLWSVDLPPPLEPELHGQVALAVPDEVRSRWTYVRGSSRRRLAPLLDRVRPIDLFVHDSAHTARNVLFELEHAWDALLPGGAVAVDDVDLNCGFHDFRDRHATASALVCHAEPLTPDLPRQDGCGVFAVVRKPVEDPTDFAQ